MFPRPFVLTIFAATTLLAVNASAFAQDEGEPPTFSERLEKFGRSIMGTKNNARQPNQQRSMRNANTSQQQLAPRYDAPFDDGVSGGNVAQQPSRPRTAAAPNMQSSRRTAADVRAEQLARPAAPVRATGTNNGGTAAPATPPRSVTPAAAAPTAAAVNPTNAIVPPPRMARSDTGPRANPGPAAAPASAPPQDNLIARRTSPSISVETVGPRKISIGKQATYKLVMKNSGEMPASDVVVAVVVPDWAEIVDAKATSGTTEPGQTAQSQNGLQWKLGTLASQGREELALEVVPHKSQPFDLGIRWTQAPLASQTTVEVQEPKLTLSLEGAHEVAFGERSIYKLVLTNPGNGDAENVTITLMPLNPGDGQPATHPLGTLRPSETKSVEIELVARQPGQVTIHAEATAAGDIKATLAEEVVVRRAALEVAVVGPKLQYATTPATYEIRVKNAGNAPARQLRVACRLPHEAEYVSSSSSGQHSTEANLIEWSLASLEAGAELTVSTKCLLRASGSNKLEVSCTADGDLQQAASALTQVEAVADLAMEVTDPSGPVPVGQEMNYEVKIRNRGTKSAEAIDVVCYFSTGIEPVGVDGGPHEIKTGMVILRTIPVLEMGREAVYKIKARAEVPGNHRFRAELICKPLDTKLTEEEATLFYADPDAAK